VFGQQASVPLTGNSPWLEGQSEHHHLARRHSSEQTLICQAATTDFSQQHLSEKPGSASRLSINAFRFLLTISFPGCDPVDTSAEGVRNFQKTIEQADFTVGLTIF
jgi:hypothetical protein